MLAKKIVVVEDDESIRKTFALLLGKKYRVSLAKDGKEAIQKYAGTKVDLIITDLKLPDLTGLELMAQFREAGFKGEAMLISAYPDLLKIDQLTRCGIRYYFTKPLDLELFSRSIDQVLEPKDVFEKMKTVTHI
jgi:DNA-binding NtrC family response regulator